MSQQTKKAPPTHKIRKGLEVQKLERICRNQQEKSKKSIEKWANDTNTSEKFREKNIKRVIKYTGRCSMS